MDPTQPVEYRGFVANTVTVTAGVMAGTQIERMNFSPVQAVGYREKRALDHGLDASDVFLGGRQVAISGKTYGSSRADLFDRLQGLLEAFSPADAYEDDTANLGYEPLSFRVGTLDTDFPADIDGNRWIDLYINVRPINPPDFDIVRDRLGGADIGSMIPWGSRLEARDPRIYIDDPQAVALSGLSGSGGLPNRGRFPSPLSVRLNIAANNAATRFFDLTVPGTTMTITVPISTPAQTLFYDGYKKVLYRTVSGVTSKAMSLLEIDNHARSLPGAGSYSFTITSNVLTAGSALEYVEAWG